jgi:hypothetical protein
VKQLVNCKIDYIPLLLAYLSANDEVNRGEAMQQACGCKHKQAQLSLRANVFLQAIARAEELP